MTFSYKYTPVSLHTNAESYTQYLQLSKHQRKGASTVSLAVWKWWNLCSFECGLLLRNICNTHTHTDTQRWSENIADHWLVIKNRHLYDTEQPESSRCLCSDRFLKHVCFIFSSLLSCWSLAFSETKFVSLLWNTATYWKSRTPSLWYPLKVLCLCSVEDNVMAVSWGYCYDYQLRILSTSRGYHLQWKTKIEKITWYQKWVELSRNMQWKQDVWCVLKSLTHQNV